MAWWNPFKKVKHEVDPFLLGGIPLFHLFEKKMPFYGWNTSINIPETIKDIADLSVWAYQTFIYLLLVRQKYGEEVAKTVRFQMVLAGDRTKEKIGSNFEQLFKIIEQGIQANASKQTIGTKDGVLPVPSEIPIALALLIRMPGSPFFATDPKEVPEFKNEEDDILAECLILAKNAALETFSPLIEKVVLNPESVKHLRVNRH